jgi:ABC-2 type transport system ATP-binding protein
VRTTAPAVLVENLRKRYGGTVAVDDLSLRVDTGEVFGVLGTNGAGKTTTVEIIAGLRPPDRGRVSVLGLDPRRSRALVRQVLGVQLQQANLHSALTVAELIALYRSFYPDPRPAEELLDLVGLAEQRGIRFEALSGGQQQRLSIALALAGRPRVVILDELTTGLDPRARRRMWTSIEQLRAEDVTVVLVSHSMAEVERLCDRVALLDAGRVVALGTPAELVARAGSVDLDDAFVALTGRKRRRTDEHTDRGPPAGPAGLADADPVRGEDGRARHRRPHRPDRSAAADPGDERRVAGDAPVVGGRTALEVFVLPLVLTVVVASIGVINMPSFLAYYRRAGILRRLAVTPASPAMVLVAQVVVSVVQAAVGVTAALVVAVLGFGAALPDDPAAALGAFGLATAALYAVGMVVAASAPTPNSAVAIGLIVFFGLGALGGLFGGRDSLPDALATVGERLPFGAAVEAMSAVWVGTAVQPVHLVSLGITTVVGAAVAAALFRWD